MTNQHPVTPPPDKIHNWLQLEKTDCTLGQIITIAAQWGADTELEACCQALYSRYVNTGLLPATAETVSQEMRDWLRAVRRPKPPSLKQQALEQLGCIQTDLNKFGMGMRTDTILAALETLPND
jgi:hypothetical protein